MKLATSLVSVLLASSTSALTGDIAPKLVGSCIVQRPTAITLGGSRAFLTSAYDPWKQIPGGLQIVDISDATNPKVLSTYRMSRPAWDVAVAGVYAYVAAEGDGLIILDVSDPAVPKRVGGYNTPESAYGVWIEGAHAFVADGQAGLLVLDISTPTFPRRVGSLDVPGEVHDVVVSGNFAFLADRFQFGFGAPGALRIIDISAPERPQLVAEHVTQDQAWSLGFSGALLCVASPSKLELIDVTDPLSPILVGSYSPGGNVISISGKLAAVGGHLLDLSTPAAPRRVGGYGGRILALSPYHAYATIQHGSGSGEFHTLDVLTLTEPPGIARVGAFDTEGASRAVAVSDGRAYLSDGNLLRLIDIADARRPLLLGQVALAQPAAVPGRYQGVYVRLAGHNAYAGGLWWDPGLKAYGSLVERIDVSNPVSPEVVGSYQPSRYFNAFDAIPDRVFLGFSLDSVWDGSRWVRQGRIDVVDWKDAANPELTASLDLPGPVWDFAVQGPYIFVAAGSEGLLVVDSQDPSRPKLVGSTLAMSEIDQVTLSGSRLYARGGTELHVFDISDPIAPVLIATHSIPNTGWNTMTMIASDSLLYIGAGDAGVRVFDLRDPRQFRDLGGNSAVLAQDISVSGYHLFVAGEADGMQVLEMKPLGEPAPRLSIARTSQGLQLSWPSVPGATLEQTSDLANAAGWTAISVAPVNDGDQNVLHVPVTAPEVYYRLRMP